MDKVSVLLDVKTTPWDAVLSIVYKECHGYGEAFFNAVGYEGFFDGYACLTMPDEFRENWIRTHYGDLLRRAFKEVFGDEFVDYKVRRLASSTPIPEIQITNKPPVSVINSVRAAKYKEKLQQSFEGGNLYPNYTFENFIEGTCNSIALRACESFVENPKNSSMNPLLIYGSSGLGKTHLLHSIAARLKKTEPTLRVVYRQAYDFLRDSVSINKAKAAKEWGKVKELQNSFEKCYEKCDVLLIDDIQLLERGVQTQEKLATLIKYLKAIGKQVVLSCDRHPSGFQSLATDESPKKNNMIPQLRVNFLRHLKDCVAIGLEEPDLTTRMNLIQRKSFKIPFVESDRKEICYYLSIQPRANIRLIEGTLNWLNAMHTLNNVDLNLSNVKRLMTSSQEEKKALITIKSIAETVAVAYHVDTVILSSKRQDIVASIPRKVAMYLCRELTTESLKNIGAFFNRDYATVIASSNSISSQINKDEELTRKVNDIRYMLES